ncbi:hypothetical protein ACHRV5_14810 [Flavobacterium sp. FlaQc-52]|jgi:hypothetical protein|uniref:hypothetical protein n=1 Tax=Flavobacterium sp. FlaQc-52 TaxID=3374185 RepID=UPI003757D4B5
MNSDLDTLIDFNLNLINKGLDIRRLEFRGLDSKILNGNDKSLAIFDFLSAELIIDENSYGKIYLLKKGIEIINLGGWIKYLEENEEIRKKGEIKEELEVENLKLENENYNHIKSLRESKLELNNLAVENLKLQNENYNYAQSLRDKEQEIKNLTVENLKLQNRQLKRYIFYSFMGVIFGVIISNFGYVLSFLKP